MKRFFALLLSLLLALSLAACGGPQIVIDVDSLVPVSSVNT